MIQFKGGDGSTKEKAVIILNAESETQGVDAEYEYLDSKYGEYELVDQTFVGNDKKQYDILTILLPDQGRKEIWFDVIDFYGMEDE